LHLTGSCCNRFYPNGNKTEAFKNILNFEFTVGDKEKAMQELCSLKGLLC